MVKISEIIFENALPLPLIRRILHSDLVPDIYSIQNKYFLKGIKVWQYRVSWIIWQKIKATKNKDLFVLFFNLIGIDDQEIINILYTKYMDFSIFNEVKKYYGRLITTSSVKYTRDTFIEYLKTLPSKLEEVYLWWSSDIRTYDEFMLLKHSINVKKLSAKTIKPIYSNNGSCFKTKNGRKVYRYF